MIYKWIDVENNPLKGRGSMSDARELNVYEAIMGATFVHRSQGKNPNSTVSNYLHELYMIFQNYVYASLELQTTYKGLIDTEYMVLKDNGALEYDFTNFNATMKELYNAEKYEKIVAIKELLTQASAYKPKLAMQLFSNLQMLGLENEYFYKIIADNVLLAKADGGNLSGSSAADHITGSDNVDKIYAGSGNDTILESAGTDTIKFGAGIDKEKITFKRISSDLSLKYEDNNIKISNYFLNNSYKIEKIELKNGEFITSTQINKIIEQLNTYANDNGLTSITHDDIASNQNLMQLVMSGWGN